MPTLTATGGRIYTDPYEPHTLAADTLTLNAQSLGWYFGPFSTIYYLDMSVHSLIATVAQRADIAEADV